MRQVMLTTTDNPFDPFDNFVEWLKFDRSKGYFSSELLGRVSVTSNELPETDETRMIEEAIDTIVRIDEFGVFKKLVREA